MLFFTSISFIINLRYLLGEVKFHTVGGYLMIQLIVGNKGKGKTKQLLDKVNAEVLEAMVILFTSIKALSICSS